MELQKVYLNLASRWLLVRALNQCSDHTPIDNKIIRDIRKVFELKHAKKEYRKLERDREIEIFKAQEIEREDNEKYLKAKEKGEGDKYDFEDIEIPERIDWDDLIDTPARGYTIDDTYISWLRTLLTAEKTDWSKIKYLDSSGKLIVEETMVTASLAEAIANLNEAIEKAVSVRDEQALLQSGEKSSATETGEVSD